MASNKRILKKFRLGHYDSNPFQPSKSPPIVEEASEDVAPSSFREEAPVTSKPVEIVQEPSVKETKRTKRPSVKRKSKKKE
jgi:hypothetical protein